MVDGPCEGGDIHRGKCYKLFSSVMVWEEAARTCASFGGRLSLPRDEGEWHYLQSIVHRSNEGNIINIQILSVSYFTIISNKSKYMHVFDFRVPELCAVECKSASCG